MYGYLRTLLRIPHSFSYKSRWGGYSFPAEHLIKVKISVKRTDTVQTDTRQVQVLSCAFTAKNESHPRSEYCHQQNNRSRRVSHHGVHSSHSISSFQSENSARATQDPLKRMPSSMPW